MPRNGCEDAPARVLTSKFSPWHQGLRKSYRVRAVPA